MSNAHAERLQLNAVMPKGMDASSVTVVTKVSDGMLFPMVETGGYG
jgi:hypothetical protein